MMSGNNFFIGLALIVILLSVAPWWASLGTVLAALLYSNWNGKRIMDMRASHQRVTSYFMGFSKGDDPPVVH